MTDDLKKLIASERAALNLPGLKRAIIHGYVLSGGHLSVAREIFIRGATEYTAEELNKEDLPGPDSLKPLLVPKITDMVSRMMGKLFDDFVR